MRNTTYRVPYVAAYSTYAAPCCGCASPCSSCALPCSSCASPCYGCALPCAVAPCRLCELRRALLQLLCAADVPLRAADVLPHLLPKRARDDLHARDHLGPVQRLCDDELLRVDGVDLSRVHDAVHDVSLGVFALLHDVQFVRCGLRELLRQRLRRQRLRQRLLRRQRGLRFRRRRCVAGLPVVRPNTAAPRTFAPDSGASGPAAPAPVLRPNPAPSNTPGGASPYLPPVPEKPAAPSGLKPITPSGNNSAAPQPIDARNQTASRQVYRAGYFQLIASPPKKVPVYDASLDDSGWCASHD